MKRMRHFNLRAENALLQLEQAEQGRDRLAQELQESQAREAALNKALRIMVEDRGFNFPQSAAMDFVQEVVNRPSPVNAGLPADPGEE